MLLSGILRRVTTPLTGQHRADAHHVTLDDKVSPLQPAGSPNRTYPVLLVGAGPGSADLITLRGANALRSADIVFYDRLVDQTLLDFAPKAAEKIYVGKAPGYHSWLQHRINAALVQAALQGKRVVRLKCGDPGVFARGAEEACALRAAGLTFEIIPGVTAASACAAEAGLFMTERDAVDTLIFTTATSHEHGLPPDWLQHLRAGVRMAIYMGVHTLPKMSDTLRKSKSAAEIEVTIVSKLGQPEAKTLFCSGLGLKDLIQYNPIENPAIIFVTLPKHMASGSTFLQFERRCPAQLRAEV